MAEYTKCDNSTISAEELLNAVVVKKTDGTYGLRTVVSDNVACGDISGLSCDQPNLSLEDILRKVVVIDGCGKPAIHLVIAQDL